MTPTEDKLAALNNVIMYERQEKERYFRLYQQACETAQRRLSELVQLEARTLAAIPVECCHKTRLIEQGKCKGCPYE